MVKVSALAPYFRNPRVGDVEAIARSLAALGQYRPLVVNRGMLTGRPLEVLAGNHTLAAARQLGWDEVAASFVDLDDAGAAQVVVADNRIADLGSYDNRELLGLLGTLAEDELVITGYATADLESIEAAMVQPEAAEWSAAFGGLPLPGEEQDRFTMSFTLTAAQLADVEAALLEVLGDGARVQDGVAVAAVAARALEVFDGLR